MEVLRVTSSFLSLSWNWFHGNRAINLHFLHRNYYFIFLIPHLIDLRSLFIYVEVEINLFDVRNIVFEYWNKIRFTSFPSFQDLIFVSEFEYSNINSNTWIFTYRSFSIFRFKKFEYSNARIQIQIFEIQVQLFRIQKVYSDSDSNIRVPKFKYSSIQIDIQIFKIQIARWCLLQWLYLISKW